MRLSHSAGALVLAALPLAINAATYVDIPLTDVRDHTFSADGYLFATSGNRLVKYDLLDCVVHEQLVANRQLMGVDVSPDDQFIAVAASGLTKGKAGFYYKNRYGTRSFPQFTYTPAFYESGTYMPMWMKSNELLMTGMFAGSGWVPMRQFEPISGGSIQQISVRQNSMLAGSDAGMTAIVESNISSGPLHAWHNKSQAVVATVNTAWFVYEVAVNPAGTRYVVPTYNGAYVYDLVGSTFNQAGLIGQYANHGPVGAVFSPDATKLITADWSWNTPANRGIKLRDARTLELLGTLDSYPFPSTGNHALGQGRLSRSPDGHWLAATIGGGIRLYDVSQELTGQYLGGCASSVPTIADPSAVENQSSPPPFDAWGWPLDSGGSSNLLPSD
jgi:hypothetical protein